MNMCCRKDLDSDISIYLYCAEITVHLQLLNYTNSFFFILHLRNRNILE